MRTPFLSARPTVAILAVALVTALSSAAGCTAAAEPTKAACGAVIDITGFRQYAQAEEFLNQHVRNFLKGCDWLAYAAITGNSEGSPCQTSPVPLYVLPEENPNDNPKIADTVRRAHLAEAVAKAKELLACDQDDAQGSDVLGGLRVIAGQLEHAPDDDMERSVVVFSDMMSNVGALDLSSGDYGAEAARTAKVKELQDKSLLPELTGATVDVYGFNLLSEREPDRVPPLKLLWKAIFVASGVDESDVSLHQ
ncbi:hypothetical protein GCM10023194_37120 [Planotetraspora phitsanulokensis]|uniref:Lipoprotein n=1 Tax=Planotetraspora phitsanulokensis TaxID=575192 RepID=A0A8J3U0U7_9ACTN|nr:hypothetical protein [Planotetraspora phitsanulokensis]GII36161.1 hypothetical protein Pph01_11640 [Planotetraspora phitsanulokensis]